MKLITLGTTCSEKTDKMTKMKSNIKYLKESFTKKTSKVKDFDKRLDQQSEDVVLETYRQILSEKTPMQIAKVITNVFNKHWNTSEWISFDDDRCEFVIKLKETQKWEDLFESGHLYTWAKFVYESRWNDVWCDEQEEGKAWYEVSEIPVIRDVLFKEFYEDEFGVKNEENDYSFCSDLNKEEQIEACICILLTFDELNIKNINLTETLDVSPKGEIKPKKENIFHDHRNSDNQETPEVGDYGVNVYLKDCPFFLSKGQVEFFKMMQDAKERNTIKDPDKFIEVARKNESVKPKSSELQRLNESYEELNDYGMIEYSWDFDEDEYHEYLEENSLEDSAETLEEYIQDNVRFEVEFFDNETFHQVKCEDYYYDDLEDAFDEKVARIIINDCKKSGKGKLEISCLYDDEELDLNDNEQVNDRAMKVLSYGKFYEGCRGFILTNGVVVYTPAEHNQCTAINGVKGTFDFIRMGNIRILDHSIDIGKYPTEAQFMVLQKVIRTYSPLYMDIISGGTEISKIYERPNYEMVVRDIKKAFGVKESFTHKTAKKNRKDVLSGADNTIFNIKNLIVDALNDGRLKNVEDYGDGYWYIYYKDVCAVPFITSEEYNFPSIDGHIRDKALPYKLEYVSNNDFLYAVCLPENEEYEDNVEEIYIDFEILTTEQQRKILDCLDIDFDNMNESFTKKTSSKSEEEVRTSTDKLYDKEKIIIDSLLNGNIENDVEEDKSTISIEIIEIGKPLFCKEMPFYVDGFDEMMEGMPVRLDYDKEDRSLYVAFVPIGDYVNYYDCEFPFKELDQEEQEIIFKTIKFKS